MRTFAQKQKQPQKTESSSLARPNTATPRLNHRVELILHLQHTMGNQAVQRSLQTNSDELKAGLTGKAFPRFGYDFSRVPIYGQEADRIADRVIATPTYSAVSSSANTYPTLLRAIDRAHRYDARQCRPDPCQSRQSVRNPSYVRTWGSASATTFQDWMCIPVSPPLSGNWSNHRFASTHECRPPYPPRPQHGPATGNQRWSRRFVPGPAGAEANVASRSLPQTASANCGRQRDSKRTHRSRAARRQCGEWLQFSFSASTRARVAGLPTAAACTVGSGLDWRQGDHRRSH